MSDSTDSCVWSQPEDTFAALGIEDGASLSVQQHPPSVTIADAGADINGEYELDGFWKGSPRFKATYPPRDVWLRIGTVKQPYRYWCLEGAREGYPGNGRLYYAIKKPMGEGPEGLDGSAQWPRYQPDTASIGPRGRNPPPSLTLHNATTWLASCM